MGKVGFNIILPPVRVYTRTIYKSRYLGPKRISTLSKNVRLMKEKALLITKEIVTQKEYSPEMEFGNLSGIHKYQEEELISD